MVALFPTDNPNLWNDQQITTTVTLYLLSLPPLNDPTREKEREGLPHMTSAVGGGRKVPKKRTKGTKSAAL